MSHWELRKAQPADAELLAYVQTESWKAAFADILDAEELARCTDMKKTTAMYEKVLANPAIHMNLLLVDGKAHGITAWSRNRGSLPEQVAELICIHSLPDKWRKGYGSLMMEQALKEMEESTYEEAILWVFADNARARAFYEKHGFVLSGQEKLAQGIKEIMYQKKL